TGTAVCQPFSAARAGQASVDQALQAAQQITLREMTEGGYIKWPEATGALPGTGSSPVARGPPKSRAAARPLPPEPEARRCGVTGDGHDTYEIDRAPDDGALRPPASRVDGRAAGDDALFLLHRLQPSDTGRA